MTIRRSLSILGLFASVSLAQVRVSNLPNMNGGGIAATYLGTGSANTAKTTGAVTLTTPATSAMTLIVGLGCSGNFAASNWAAAITDSAGNIYVPIGATSGTYPQANGTTQVCVFFVAKNSSAVTTTTFTISGSSSANTTVSVMAWGVTNSFGTLAAVDGWAAGKSASATALSTQILVPSHANELVIAGGCASTGTISLPSTSALTFDSGSVAIASGSNCATVYGGSAVMGDPVGVTGAFTDGSSAAYSEVAIVLKPYSLTDSGQVHLTGSMAQGSAGSTIMNTHPALASPPPMQAVSVLAGTGVTASCAVTGFPGRTRIVTGFSYGIDGDATGAAAQLSFSVTDSINVSYQAYVNNPSGVGALGQSQAITGLAIPVFPGFTVTAAFSGNVAHALEYCNLYYYEVDLPNITF